jgi:integrating conjugative element protein (TIGR03749 family)
MRMWFQFPVLGRRQVVSLLPWALVLVLVLGAGPALAEEPLPERIVWQKTPIPLVLTVGQERRVDFPGPVKVGVPPPLASKLRVQSIAGTLYLLAHREFDATRVMVRETDSGRVYLLDLTAKDEGGSASPVTIYSVEESTDLKGPEADTGAKQNTAQNTAQPALPSYGYVTLTRFAAQQLYAPARLLRGLPGVVRVPVKRNKVALIRGAAVTAEPLVAWRAGERYLTAIKLTNLTDRALTLDPRTLRGAWLSAAFQHNRLLPKGEESDTTALYLISARPFEASL